MNLDDIKPGDRVEVSLAQEREANPAAPLRWYSAFVLDRCSLSSAVVFACAIEHHADVRRAVVVDTAHPETPTTERDAIRKVSGDQSLDVGDQLARAAWTADGVAAGLFDETEGR